MKIRAQNKSFMTLESVAMTDIVMNLFIFFFISFSLLYTFNPHKESKIEVKLPQGLTQAESKGDHQTLVVTITSGNEIFIDKKRVLPTQIQSELKKRAQSTPATGLLVRSDKQTSVDFLVKVLDAAKQAGLERLGVAIETSK